MKKLFVIQLFALSILAFFSCKKEATPSSHPIEMRLTDAAGPYDAVLIDVQSVEVNSNTGNSGWVTLNTKAGIYDLTHFTAGVDTLLATGDIPSGTISQIRLVLGNNNSVVVGGKSYPLQTPSAQQSGLKLQVHETLTEGVTYKITLDFDAAKSIVAKGNGGYSLKPVIRTVTTATSGAIKGIVSPKNSRPSISAVMGTDTFGALADTLGNFLIRGVPAGTYTVYFAPASPYLPKNVTGVNVTTGQVTDMGTVTIP